jgi:hypothetical protein
MKNIKIDYFGYIESVSDFEGSVIQSINVSEDKDEINFTLTTGESFKMYHMQDCCESVLIDDIDGDLQDLVGQRIEVFEERTSELGDEEVWESLTWTFYTIRTIKNSVTITWRGESNGCYSESVDIKQVKERK